MVDISNLIFSRKFNFNVFLFDAPIFIYTVVVRFDRLAQFFCLNKREKLFIRLSTHKNQWVDSVFDGRFILVNFISDKVKIAVGKNFEVRVLRGENWKTKVWVTLMIVYIGTNIFNWNL